MSHGEVWWEGGRLGEVGHQKWIAFLNHLNLDNVNVRCFCLYLFLCSVFMSLFLLALSISVFVMYVSFFSDFSRKPQSTQTSHSDKPPVIKASMSQSSLELDLMNQQWNEVRFQPVQNQRSPNLRRPEISKKEEFILKHQTQVEQVPTQTNIKKNFSCVVPSQGLSDQAYVRVNLQSSGYCKLSLYNEPQHSQSHSGVTQNISRDNKDSGDHGNGSLRNNSVRYVFNDYNRTVY